MPGLTAELFVANPFKSGEKMYKTGDLARWRPDGTIEFLGRMDRLVKVRGFRVDPAQVESLIKKTAHIKDAVVTAKVDKNGETYLCGYIVSPGPLDVPGIKEYLSRHVPDYMIPTRFVKIAGVPVTSGGKLDRKALPDPVFKTQDPHTAPANEIEEKLAAIWAAVLNLDKRSIGLYDSFFELGGHSITSAVLITKINKEFGIPVPLVEFFKAPTIKNLARHIQGIEKGAVIFEEDDSLVLLKNGSSPAGL
jgi:acyl carrier protein